MSWYDDVKVGDRVHLDPLYNQSVRPPDRIRSPAFVHGVWRGRNTQTGTVFLVKPVMKGAVELDAGWFTGVAK